ncbi:efflux RND transporter periplasmic adaptor subunit [Trinickia symbiotica]|nr:efflux RND transporter periplasmic adaptor subunit [Trinickia symbiotica]
MSTRTARAAISVAAVTALLTGFARHACADEAQAGVVAVQTVRAERGTISEPVRAYGIVAASQSNVTTLSLPYVVQVARLLVQPGQTVKRGTPIVLVKADAAALLAADQAQTALSFARGELARTQSLYDQHLATASQVAAAQKSVEDARQALAAQRQMGVGSGARTIAAPADGVVLQVSVSQGDQVAAGSAIAQIATTSGGTGGRANVMLGVEPDDAGAVHEGDTVTLHGLSALLSKQTVTGRITTVGAAIDAQSHLVDVGANVPLRNSAFIPGTQVSADIATRSGTHWIVPRSAVLTDGHGTYLFQVTQEHKAHRVPVAVAIENGERYGVDGALDATLPVVTVGNYELEDGAAVRGAGESAR